MTQTGCWPFPKLLVRESMAGTPDELPSCAAQQPKAKLPGFPDLKAAETDELDAGHGETQSYAKEALTATSVVETVVHERPE
eukprot:6186821-Pleurochrysis_carterae.AAC.2